MGRGLPGWILELEASCKLLNISKLFNACKMSKWLTKSPIAWVISPKERKDHELAQSLWKTVRTILAPFDWSNDRTIFRKKLAALISEAIPGLMNDIPVRGDNRGWFKENFKKCFPLVSLASLRGRLQIIFHSLVRMFAWTCIMQSLGTSRNRWRQRFLELG